MKKKSFFKKCELLYNAICKLFANIKKAWQVFKKHVVKVISLVMIVVAICACNAVHATVKGGTTTTITVTTNNPSTTQVNPNTQTDLKLK